MNYNNKKITNIFAHICALFCVVVLTFSLSGCSDGETSDAMIESGMTYDTEYVTTPKGTNVEVWIFDQEVPVEHLNEARKYQETYYPDVTVLRDPTGKYNCHSYAWYDTSSSNTYWMNDPTPYMTDGSYDMIASTTDFTKVPSEVSYNAKVVWLDSSGEAIHSGIKLSSTTVVSKWGICGLYRHEQNYSPYTPEKIEYYS